MYRYILLRTNMEFLYCPVPSRTGTYWYVPVRTILPNPVQGYRIPDDTHIYGRAQRDPLPPTVRCDSELLQGLPAQLEVSIFMYMYVYVCICMYMNVYVCIIEK